MQLDEREPKPRQATCPPPACAGNSRADSYTSQRRASSYHWLPMRARKSPQVFPAWLQLMRVRDAGLELGSRLEEHPLGAGIV